MKRFSGMNDAMDAMWMTLSAILVGALIGLFFHHWPMPVNESVFIPADRRGK